MRSPMELPFGVSEMNLTFDSFYDPNEGEFSQWNSDVRVQAHRRWYVEVGQRFTRSGQRVRRGDIWNPVSFNEVLASQEKISFLTAGGAARLPFGLTVGTKWYHDFAIGETAEWDLVGLYQNPCRCFSIGAYYIRFQDREQFNMMLSLTGLFATQGLGGQLIENILSPLFAGEKGMPWGN
jgi:LPS-assembly protein